MQAQGTCVVVQLGWQIRRVDLVPASVVGLLTRRVDCARPGSDFTAAAEFLLGSQGHQRVDAYGFSRWQVAGDQRHYAQEERDDDEREPATFWLVLGRAGHQVVLPDDVVVRIEVLSGQRVVRGAELGEFRRIRRR